MGATNKTTNYELPKFIGTDKPTFLGDWNGAMDKIDTAIKQASQTGGSGSSGNQTPSDTSNLVSKDVLNSAFILKSKTFDLDISTYNDNEANGGTGGTDGNYFVGKISQIVKYDKTCLINDNKTLETIHLRLYCYLSSKITSFGKSYLAFKLTNIDNIFMPRENQYFPCNFIIKQEDSNGAPLEPIPILSVAKFTMLNDEPHIEIQLHNNYIENISTDEFILTIDTGLILNENGILPTQTENGIQTLEELPKQINLLEPFNNIQTLEEL